MVKKVLSKHLRIVGDGSVTGTHVFLEDGTEVPGVTKVTMLHERGALPRVTLEVIDTGKNEVAAVLDLIEREYLPPPLPKTEIRMYIYAPMRRFLRRGEWRYWRLERHKPLGTFGGMVTPLAEGWMRVKGIDELDEFLTLTCEDLP